jgi:uncharacterized protein YbjT (DUF2867 family)
MRDPSLLTPRSNQTAEPFDLDNASTFERALSGADVLGLVTPPDPKQVERESAVIAAAKRAGVGRIIKVSVIGADMPTPISQFARWSKEMEGVLASAQIPHVILRPTTYMQNLLRQRKAIDSGTYTEPLGTARITSIDVRDTADAAVVVAGGRFDGRALVLTGSEELTGPEIARVLSEGCGHPVRFVSPDLQAFKGALDTQGTPAWRASSHLELYGAIQSGLAPHLAVISNDFMTLTGRKPRTLLQFVRTEFAKQQ